MPDLAALVTPPLLLDSTGAPANGDIYARLTQNVTIGAGIATPTQVQGVIVKGQFKSLAGAAFNIPVTPEGVAVELFVELVEERPHGVGSTRDRHSIRRVVSVPDQSTVTWDELIDTIPVESGGDVVIPSWVATTQAASVAAVAAAAASTAAKDNAEAAEAAAAASAASVAPGVAGGTATLDGSAKVPDAQLPTRLSDATLAASFAPLTAKVYTSTTGDQTTALQAFLTGLSNGDEALLRGAAINFTTLTIARSNVTIRLAPGAVLNKTTAATDGILVTGSNVTLSGGSITCPATFDGTNVAPTYAVIRFTGAGGRVEGVTLTNVPKVGIYFDDADDGQVTGCRIVGNYPAGSYTGVETGHFGVALNPGGSGRSGRHRVDGNLILSCVQGVFMGNYGAASTGAYGTVITGNIFDGCHNHGVYNAGGLDAVAVTGNTFTRCALPVALTGPGHTVTGNTMFTHATGNNLDVAGVSLREPVGCTIVGNTIKGDATAGAVIIDLANYVSGSTAMSDNVVSGNTINVTGGSSAGIRVGRLTQTATCTNNIVADNVISSVGNVGVGVITLAPATSAVAYGNKITGNSITVRGESHGIYVANTQHTTVQANTVRFEYNAGSAKTLGCVQLSASARSIVSGNDFYNGAGFGTNVSIRGIWEAAGCTNNKYGPNSHDGTGATAYTSIVTVSGTACFVDESGAGSPSGAFFAVQGSRWARTDGAALTSFYIKETDSTSATWVAK